MKLLFIVIFGLLNVSASAVVNQCHELELLLSQRVKPEDVFQTNNLPDVFIVTDAHNNSTWANKTVEVLQAIKKNNPKVDCLFLEHPSDLQSPLNSYAAQTISWLEYVEQAVSMATSVFNEEDMEAAKQFFSYKEELAKYARQQGLKIYAVDATFNQQKKMVEELGFIRGFILGRNDVMTTSISNLIDEKKCSQGVLFVGDAHVLWTPKNEKQQTLQAFFKMKGVAASTTLVRNFSEFFEDSPLAQAPVECQNTDLIPKTEFAMKGPVTRDLNPQTDSDQVDDIEILPLKELSISNWLFLNYDNRK